MKLTTILAMLFLCRWIAQGQTNGALPLYEFRVALRGAQERRVTAPAKRPPEPYDWRVTLRYSALESLRPKRDGAVMKRSPSAGGLAGVIKKPTVGGVLGLFNPFAPVAQENSDRGTAWNPIAGSHPLPSSSIDPKSYVIPGITVFSGKP